MRYRFIKKIILIFVLILFVQLAGITCIQDILGAASSSLQDDCPCHYLVIHPSSIIEESAPYTGDLSLLKASFMEDKLPLAIFHPPLLI